MDMSTFTHHERRDAKQVSHRRHARTFTIVDVDLTSVVDGASESIGEVKKIRQVWFVRVAHFTISSGTI
jgi:hypothetical protein